MLKYTLLSGICSIIFLASTNTAHAHDATFPDSHAPIGVMGDHTHKEGEWMLSYRYNRMEMKGNRDGTHRASNDQVLNSFMVTPLDMSMQMHMFNLMYGATDNLTVMAMLPYMQKSMHHINRMGRAFETESEGLGDIKLNGTYTLLDTEVDSTFHRSPHKLLLNLGASLPTGSITERANTPAGNNQKLPYPMQLGSGTVDPLLGLTYLNNHQDWSLGAELNTILRFGENNEGYRLGNEYTSTAWIARNVNKYASVSFRLEGNIWGNIHGQDNDLNPMMAPTARTDLRGGERIDALVGINLYQPEGKLAGNRLAAEFGMPIYQHLNGPQLETDYRFTLAWQLAF